MLTADGHKGTSWSDAVITKTGLWWLHSFLNLLKLKVIHWVNLMVYLNTWLKTKNQWTQEMEECAHWERMRDIESLHLRWDWRKKSSRGEYRYRRLEISDIVYRNCISSLVGYSCFFHCTWHLGSRQPLLIVEDWWILFVTLC